MSAYELGIKAYHEKKLPLDNPFIFGSQNHGDWENGWWDGWFEKNYPSK